MSDHTPGPWGYRTEAGPNRTFGVYRSVFEPYVALDINTEADARLISAAPELLGVAFGVLGMLGEDAHKFKVGELARAAIVKAIGREVP